MGITRLAIIAILFLIGCIIGAIIAKSTIAVLLFWIGYVVLAIYKQLKDKR